MRKALLTYKKKKGLYQNKVTFSLASTQRQGHQALNCKMVYRGQQRYLRTFLHIDCRVGGINK